LRLGVQKHGSGAWEVIRTDPEFRTTLYANSFFIELRIASIIKQIFCVFCLPLYDWTYGSHCPCHYAARQHGANLIHNMKFIVFHSFALCLGACSSTSRSRRRHQVHVINPRVQASTQRRSAQRQMEKFGQIQPCQCGGAQQWRRRRHANSHRLEEVRSSCSLHILRVVTHRRVRMVLKCMMTVGSASDMRTSEILKSISFSS
jgi:hypothetical protein